MRYTIVVLFLAIMFSKFGSKKTKCEQETVRVDLSKEPVRIKLKNGQQLIGNRKVVRIEKKFSIQEKIVYEFLGIPFAKAPLDEKRFEFPHRLTYLLPMNIYDATYSRPSCWQEADTSFPGFRGSEMWNPPQGVSEDCLYFNIWIPVTKEQDSLLYNNYNRLTYYPNAFRSSREKLKPTLFWIYGGSFNTGSSNLKITDGTIPSSFEDAIIITSNYRVGPFGFLFLNSSSAPGNAGLADQVMALEWYKENYLDYFGGARDQVCLFGESAGSISINLLLLSNKAHIFNRGILQSLSSYLDIGFRKPHDALKISLDLAEKVGCLEMNENFTTNEPALNLNHSDRNAPNLNRLQSEILRCLLKQNSSILSQLQFEIGYVNDHLKMQFLPTMDYHGLIADDPLDFRFEKLKSKIHHEILIGINYDESTFFSFYYYYGNYFELDKFLKPSIKYDNKFILDRVVESLRTKKVPNFKITSVNFQEKPSIQITYSNRQNELVKEHFFKKYANCLYNLYTNEYNKYQDWDGSELNFDLDASDTNSPYSAWKKFSKIISDVIYSCPTIKLANRYNVENSNNTYFYRFSKRNKKNPWPEWMGVIHGYEIEYIFGMPWVDKDNFEDDDRDLSRLMMSYWVNFARTGKLSSPHDRVKNRDFFVELGPRNRNLTEQEELEMFNLGYPMCDYLNNYVKPDQEYAGQFEQCLNYQNDKTLILSSAISIFDICFFKIKLAFILVVYLLFYF